MGLLRWAWFLAKVIHAMPNRTRHDWRVRWAALCHFVRQKCTDG